VFVRNKKTKRFHETGVNFKAVPFPEGQLLPTSFMKKKTDLMAELNRPSYGRA